MLSLILTALVIALMVLIVCGPVPRSRERIVAVHQPYAERCRIALLSTVAPLDTPQS